MKTHNPSAAWGRRERCLALALTILAIALLAWLLVAPQVHAAPADTPAAQRITEWGTINAVTYISGLTRYVSGTTDAGHHFGAYTIRSFRAGQRVRLTGTVNGRYLENARIR